MLCGAVASIIAQTCTYPFDIVRRRMQSEIHTGCTARYRTIFGVGIQGGEGKAEENKEKEGLHVDINNHCERGGFYEIVEGSYNELD